MKSLGKETTHDRQATERERETGEGCKNHIQTILHHHHHHHGLLLYYSLFFLLTHYYTHTPILILLLKSLLLLLHCQDSRKSGP